MAASPVVLDTNVFVGAGFNPGSASARIVEAVRRGRLPLVWDDATRREIERVLGRIPPLRRLTCDDLFRAEARFGGAVESAPFDGIADPDDRKFAALAHAAGAVLVTSDAHLLGWPGVAGLTILTPGDYWRAYGEAPGEFDNG
jgi:predicted nucleic acid-binding protein